MGGMDKRRGRDKEQTVPLTLQWSQVLDNCSPLMLGLGCLDTPLLAFVTLFTPL